VKPPTLPCAIYTRKSSEEGLDQAFNSLDAQREACSAYILSQKALGWSAVPAAYDDGGFSGGNTDRPALQRLLADIGARRIRIVVVYKVDRLTRSLADFAKMVELFDAQGVSFVSVTQQFNTTSSMGRLTLNVLLSFAQFEREVTGERIRDKIAASKRKGLWMGGVAPIGYRADGRTLVMVETQAAQIREIYRLYLETNCVRRLKAQLDARGWRTAERKSRRLNETGGRPFSRGHLYRILTNPIYAGRIPHKGQAFDGNHAPIIASDVWQAVQDRMAGNRQGQRAQNNTTQSSLLAGLVFDAAGDRLTPSHAKKGSVRYRYYVGRPLIEGGRDAAPQALAFRHRSSRRRWSWPLLTSSMTRRACCKRSALSMPRQRSERWCEHGSKPARCRTARWHVTPLPSALSGSAWAQSGSRSNCSRACSVLTETCRSSLRWRCE
jgi:DNA invertase Pin-like site-specific DNA recombinase